MQNLDGISPSEVIITEIASHRLVLEIKLKAIYENFCLNKNYPLEERWKVFTECFDCVYYTQDDKEKVIEGYKNEILDYERHSHR